jgi:predicted FMN-binding regulatory protein PaiB
LIPGDREKKVKTGSLPAAQGELTGLLVNMFLIFAHLPVFLQTQLVSELITKPHVSNKNKRVKSLQCIFERKW